MKEHVAREFAYILEEMWQISAEKLEQAGHCAADTSRHVVVSGAHRAHEPRHIVLQTAESLASEQVRACNRTAKRS